ncbi:hypothetical protein ACIP5U_34370 [Streptomyces sp. NPDC088788]|uniref:hypothetical protein n=1 Tax=Streptomyces sp. NPDC088788 TaxID=3365898 RepID=UPI003816C4EF
MLHGPKGWYAIYDEPAPRSGQRNRMVEAWHPETGDALVMGDRGLTPAADLPGFQGFDQCAHSIGAIPAADGWREAWRTEDGTIRTAPVVGWMIGANSIGNALIFDDDFCLVSTSSPAPGRAPETVIVPPGADATERWNNMYGPEPK